MANPNNFALNQEGAVQALASIMSGASVRLRLCTGTGLSDTSVIADLAAVEVSGNGYPVGGVTLTYDTTAWAAADSRAEATFQNTSLTPSGGDITFRQAALTYNNGTEYIWGIFTWPADELAADGVPYGFNSTKALLGGEGADVAPQ